MAHLYKTLYIERQRKDPDQAEILEHEMKTLERESCLDLYYQHCWDRPVWLLLGRTRQVYPFVDAGSDEPPNGPHVTQYLSVDDDDYLPKFQELIAQRDTNPSLKLALEAFVDYGKGTQRLGANTTCYPLPPRKKRAMTSASFATDPLDAATVVTAAPEGPASDDSSTERRIAAESNTRARGDHRKRRQCFGKQPKKPPCEVPRIIYIPIGIK
jgi:hypothetical protein